VVPYSKYELIWDNFITKAITSEEMDVTFNWFTAGRRNTSEYYLAMDDENMNNVFSRRILKFKPSMHSPNSFACFVKYFLDVNSKRKKLETKVNLMLLVLTL
jgi:hypothetical protein